MITTMQLSPHLHFNGQCETAFTYYAQHLGGVIATMMTYAATPGAQQVPPEWRNKIMHATLTLGDKVLMGCDAPPDRYDTPKGFSVVLGIKEPEEAERVFKALSDGGTAKMALQETFWAVRFGMLVDRFGIPWMINCGQAA